MICKNCKADFAGKNFGMILSITAQKIEQINICSTPCRAEYRSKIEKKKAAAGNRPAPKNARVQIRKPLFQIKK